MKGVYILVKMLSKIKPFDAFLSCVVCGLFIFILGWFTEPDLFSQVLWISDNGTPDLGGTNEEESCYTNEVSVWICACIVVWMIDLHSSIHRSSSAFVESLYALNLWSLNRLINLSSIILEHIGKLRWSLRSRNFYLYLWPHWQYYFLFKMMAYDSIGILFCLCCTDP